MSPALSVAIVGAGWAGLACALAAAAAGAQVDVYEQRSAWREAPVHVDVVPNMLRDLATLGLADVCVRGGFPYRGVSMTDAGGRSRADVACARLAGPRLPAALGLKRQTLTDALRAAAQARGVRLHWATAVQGIDAEADRARLRFAATAALASTVADVVLLATGAHVACPGMPPEPAARSTEITWWCGLVRRPAGMDQPTVVLAAPRSKVLMVPVSGDAAGIALIDAALQDVPDDVLPTASARSWLQLHASRVRGMNALMGDDIALLPVRVRAGLRSQPWYRGNLLCVGDAAHVLPQHFGQSAAQAVEDAVVFGQLLATASHAASLTQAVAERREPRVRAVFDIAQRAAHWDLHPEARTDLAALLADLNHIVSRPA